jgi:hypothetical protein
MTTARSPCPPGHPRGAARGPRQNRGLATQAWKSSSERHRVRTRHTSRSSLGRRSSNASKPGALDTRPAREAKRLANSSKRSRGAVMALILATLTPRAYGSPVAPPIPMDPVARLVLAGDV